MRDGVVWISGRGREERVELLVDGGEVAIARGRWQGFREEERGDSEGGGIG
jgi:hypothetical protein